MAKIKLSAIGITNISGKSGGSVFAHNKNGNYVRRLGIATQPQTAKQTLARSIFGVISRMWGALNQEQREAWKTFGAEHPKTDRFGDSRPLTGRQAFISVNSNLQTVSLPPLLSPVFSRLEFPTFVSFAGHNIFGNTGVLTQSTIYADVSNANPAVMFVLSAAVVSSGADFGTAKNKYVQIYVAPSDEIDMWDITPNLLALGVTKENNVYLKVEFIASNGLRTSAVTALMTQEVG